LDGLDWIQSTISKTALTLGERQGTAIDYCSAGILYSNKSIGQALVHSPSAPKTSLGPLFFDYVSPSQPAFYELASLVFKLSIHSKSETQWL
jgi:hypothetical protein